MTRKRRQNPLAAEVVTVVAEDPVHQKGELKCVGGSLNDDWNNLLANQAIQALWLNSDPQTRDRQLSATVGALTGIGPKDELEGMTAAQLIAAHYAAMECYRRAMLGEQTPEERRESLGQANKFSRTFGLLIDCLNRPPREGSAKGHCRACPCPFRWSGHCRCSHGPGGRGSPKNRGTTPCKADCRCT
jgi:hypothetical protein